MHRKDSLVIRSRVDFQTNVKQTAFINALQRVLNVSVACEIAGVPRNTAYSWRNDDPAFKERWDQAIALAEGSLEAGTYLKLAQTIQDQRKRINGAEARLIEVFLGGFFPEKYRQKVVEINNTQVAEITIDWSKVPDQVMDRFLAGDLTLKDVYQAVQLNEQASADTSAD